MKFKKMIRIWRYFKNHIRINTNVFTSYLNKYHSEILNQVFLLIHIHQRHLLTLYNNEYFLINCLHFKRNKYKS